MTNAESTMEISSVKIIDTDTANETQNFLQDEYDICVLWTTSEVSNANEELIIKIFIIGID